MLTSYKSHSAGNSPDTARHTQITFCIRHYLVKMYAARVQSTCSLLVFRHNAHVYITFHRSLRHHYIDNHPLFITEDPLLCSNFVPFGGLTSWFAPSQVGGVSHQKFLSFKHGAALHRHLHPTSHFSPLPHGPTPTIHPTILSFNTAHSAPKKMFGLCRFSNIFLRNPSLLTWR